MLPGKTRSSKEKKTEGETEWREHETVVRVRGETIRVYVHVWNRVQVRKGESTETLMEKRRLARWRGRKRNGSGVEGRVQDRRVEYIYVIATPHLLLHRWADTSAFGVRGRKADGEREREKACIYPLGFALHALICAHAEMNRVCQPHPICFPVSFSDRGSLGVRGAEKMGI